MGVFHYAVPVLYMLVFAALLVRVQWIRKAGFTKRFVILFFVAKCVAGFAYNWVALHFIPNRGDIWPYFEDGRAMYQKLLTSPGQFWQIYFSDLGNTRLDVTDTNSGIIRSAFELIKLFHCGLCFLTFGNLAVNTVIFNFLLVLCFFYCWRFLRQQMGGIGLLAGLVFFGLPSMFFYAAGILKEGFVIGLLCLLIPLTHRLLVNRFSFKTVVGWVVAFAGLFLLKFFVAALWLAATLLWWALLRAKRQRWVVAGFGVMAAIAFYVSSWLPSFANAPAYMMRRQQEFLAMPASSTIYTAPLTQQADSYLKALPVATNNVLFKPLPGEGGKALYLLYFVEITLFWIGMGYVMVQRSRSVFLGNIQRAWLISLLVFTIFNLLFIGLVIPNMGAIIRYRSIFMPFLALTALLDFQPRFLQSRKWLLVQEWISN
jgi:hypothetical protein